MNQFHKLLRRSSTERYLLVQAAFLLSTIRIAVWLLPLHTLRRLLMRISRPVVRETVDDDYIARVVWAVSAMSRRIPRATCLPQALAAQVLLGRSGYPTQLRIGLVTSEGGQLEGHAWLEHRGRILIQDFEVERFTPFVALHGE